MRSSRISVPSHVASAIGGGMWESPHNHICLSNGLVTISRWCKTKSKYNKYHTAPPLFRGTPYYFSTMPTISHMIHVSPVQRSCTTPPKNQSIRIIWRIWKTPVHDSLIMIKSTLWCTSYNTTQEYTRQWCMIATKILERASSWTSLLMCTQINRRGFMSSTLRSAWYSANTTWSQGVWYTSTQQECLIIRLSSGNIVQTNFTTGIIGRCFEPQSLINSSISRK